MNREKEQLAEECTSLISSIRQMQKSVDEYADDQSLRITLPLVKCRQELREKMKMTKKMHAERFEEIQGEFSFCCNCRGPLPLPRMHSEKKN